MLNGTIDCEIKMKIESIAIFKIKIMGGSQKHISRFLSYWVVINLPAYTNLVNQGKLLFLY
jgi:hypothetical protein